MPARDYYETLGVARSASKDDIRKAYKRIAKESHPDRNPDDAAAAERFKAATEAYEVLGDEENRQKYDQFGANYKQFNGGNPFGTGQVDINDLFGEGGIDLGDLFGGGFGGGGRRRQPVTKGQDLRTTATVPFTVSATGGQHELSVQRQGKTERLSVKIPAGIRDGATVRLAGQGHPGRGGGPNGDLMVTIKVAPHPHFTREGDHVVLELPLSITEASLGAKVDIPTLLDGEVTMTIPPGTPSGATLRLREKGFPDPRTGAKGDQRVKVKIVPPKELSERGRELLEELRTSDLYDPRAGLWP